MRRADTKAHSIIWTRMPEFFGGWGPQLAPVFSSRMRLAPCVAIAAECWALRTARTDLVECHASTTKHLRVRKESRPFALLSGDQETPRTVFRARCEISHWHVEDIVV